jgi:hypothetical protein
LLHVCCGPCALEPFGELASEHEVTLCYANPNIHPAVEYRRRRDTLAAWAADRAIEIIELPYEPASWVRAVTGAEGDPATRCPRCYRLRLAVVAAEAVQLGFDAVATTLTVSPYQDPEAIRLAGEEACAEAGVQYLHADFRDRYQEATRRSRELGMYRQNYCGCKLSEVEAERDRGRARAERGSR